MRSIPFMSTDGPNGVRGGIDERGWREKNILNSL